MSVIVDIFLRCSSDDTVLPSASTYLALTRVVGVINDKFKIGRDALIPSLLEVADCVVAQILLHTCHEGATRCRLKRTHAFGF